MLHSHNHVNCAVELAIYIMQYKLLGLQSCSYTFKPSSKTLTLSQCSPRLLAGTKGYGCQNYEVHSASEI